MNLFPIVSSYISIISPYRLDIADKKGGLMVFVKSHILSRLNDFKIPSNIQIIPFEINLRKEKCLVASIYNAPSQKQIHDKSAKILLNAVWEIIILGDFNIEAENKVMKAFL